MAYEYAGVLGIDPGPFTLRELDVMLEARRLEDWDHTAKTIQELVAVWVDQKKCRVPLDIYTFHPYRMRPPRRPDAKASVQALRVFVDGKIPPEAFEGN